MHPYTYCTHVGHVGHVATAGEGDEDEESSCSFSSDTRPDQPPDRLSEVASCSEEGSSSDTQSRSSALLEDKASPVTAALPGGPRDLDQSSPEPGEGEEKRTVWDTQLNI